MDSIQPFLDVLDRIRPLLQAFSFFGPYVIWPALYWLYRTFESGRKLYRTFPRVLTVLAVLMNRERRILDINRRVLFHDRRAVEIMRNAAKHYQWPRAWQDELEVIDHELARCDRETMALRDSAFRAREMQVQRRERAAKLERGEIGVSDELNQGELDAVPLGPIEQALR